MKLAGEVAGTLNFPWQHFRIRPTKGKDLLRLLRIKYGMNYLASSFNLPFFDEIIKTYGSKVRYFTGDMGLVTMKNHCPAKRLRNLDDLADYILYKNSFFTVDVLERLLGIKKGETKEILIEHLREYPETSMAQKNVHFQIFEKGFNWGFEGMDRNRYYFWLATPLLSTKVFRYSMSCPDDQKAPYKLYRDFLIRLSPATVDVDYADYRLPITSRKLIIKKNITSLYVNNMPIQLKMIIRKYFLKSWGSYEKDSVIIEAFLKQLDCCEQLGNYMATDIIRKNLKTFNKQQIDILFTIVSLIEAASCNHSTLHDYLEGDFF
ncbi:MAG: hypothetical protein HZB33_14280 [Nitrospirae bacterium]|nr:hypothetical protein [Nitrospirota bacterium]